MAKYLPRSFLKAGALKRNRARRGAFTVEFALLAPPFFLLMMGIIELCLMEGAQQILESAAYNTSRLGKTGYVAGGQTQAQTINQVLINELSSYGSLIDVAHVTTTQASYSSFSGAAAGGGTLGYGTEEQIVTYTITYPWKIFTPLMCSALGSACGTGSIVNLTSTIVVRNEPYG
jgi:Flp pilus assembly protein TadG